LRFVQDAIPSKPVYQLLHLSTVPVIWDCYSPPYCFSNEVAIRNEKHTMKGENRQY
jgi:hypothetical protein